MKRKGYRSPDHMCPICGAEISIAFKHKCPEKTLKAIDAAHRRSDEDIVPRGMSFYERLREGFSMMESDER